MNGPLRLTRRQAQALIHEARVAAPAECCGLLVGKAGEVQEAIPLTNVAEEPESRYLAEPGELFRALLAVEERGRELLAVYHSHPAGGAIPSATDIREAAYPQAAQLIIGLGGRRAELAAWRIERGEVTRMPMIIADEQERQWLAAEPARPWLVALGALISLALTLGLALAALT